MLECVANISEGRDRDILSRLALICGQDLLDVHADHHHHRSVFTLVGEEAVRHITSEALDLLHIDRHVDGVHPRLGIIDVVPFVPLAETAMEEALEARQSFAEWAAGALDIPCFLYGPAHGSLVTERSLPDIRRWAWDALTPDLGPHEPHPVAGAICVGARPLLVAYNIWMRDSLDGATVRQIASTMRSAHVRTLALAVGDAFQLSMNLIHPEHVGPADVYAQAHSLSEGTPARIERCELVGLIPRYVLDGTPQEMWTTLDLSPEQTIEYQLRARDQE